MPSKKRKSGGARAVEAKKRKRDAARARAKAKNERPSFEARAKKLGKAPIGKPNDAHAWLADVMILAIEDCLFDPGFDESPQLRREQLGRLTAQAAKVVPTAQLTARIAQLEEALEKSGPKVTDASAVEGGSSPAP